MVEADTLAIPAVAAAVRKLRRLMIAAATLAGLLVLPWLPGLFELKEFWPYARARTDATSPERLQPLFSSSLRSAVSNLRRTRRYQILFVVWACMPMWRLPSEVIACARGRERAGGRHLLTHAHRGLHSECRLCLWMRRFRRWLGVEIGDDCFLTLPHL